VSLCIGRIDATRRGRDDDATAVRIVLHEVLLKPRHGARASLRLIIS
jgi:hypothetical protein